MTELSDNNTNHVNKLLQALQKFPEGIKTLDMQLESASKHIPAYVKIVKGHIEQLQTVLKLENHNNRTLESVGLAKPVQQLMDIFAMLQDEDIQLLEELAFAARNWQPEVSSEQTSPEKVESTETTS